MARRRDGRRPARRGPRLESRGVRDHDGVERSAIRRRAAPARHDVARPSHGPGDFLRRFDAAIASRRTRATFSSRAVAASRRRRRAIHPRRLDDLAGRGALFTGMGGSGKSTTSICCLLGGLGYLGDDFVGLERVAERRFHGHSLYGAALINLQHMRRFPALAAVSVAGNHAHEEKSVAWLGDVPGARFESTTTIDAVVLPKVRLESDDTTFERVAAGVVAGTGTEFRAVPARGASARNGQAGCAGRKRAELPGCCWVGT